MRATTARFLSSPLADHPSIFVSIDSEKRQMSTYYFHVSSISVHACVFVPCFFSFFISKRFNDALRAASGLYKSWVQLVHTVLHDVRVTAWPDRRITHTMRAASFATKIGFSCGRTFMRIKAWWMWLIARVLKSHSSRLNGIHQDILLSRRSSQWRCGCRDAWTHERHWNELDFYCSPNVDVRNVVQGFIGHFVSINISISGDHHKEILI